MYGDSTDLSTLALVFGAQVDLFCDVVFALQVDAWRAGAEVAVLGVREDWLEREGVLRALVAEGEVLSLIHI